MTHLPDDILLLVFAQLDTDHLVREIRSVCHRWRALAVHRDAWRHRTVSSSLPWDGEEEDDVDDEHRHFLCRVLTIAPCVDALELTCGLTGTKNAALVRLMETTPCAARVLDLNLLRDDRSEYVLRNQLSRGRLRVLHLNVWDGGDCISGVIDAIKDVHLDDLAIETKDPEARLMLVPTEADEWGAGSIRGLRYSGKSTDTLLQFLLRVRSRHLKTFCCGFLDREVTSAPALSSLSRCVNLTRASFSPAVRELESLKRLPKLTTLQLSFDGNDVVPGLPVLSGPLRSYFRSASAARLTRLSLNDLREHQPEDSPNMPMLCLSELAAGGQSALKKLVVWTLSTDALVPLVGHLRGLPWLRHLKLIGIPSASFLDAICPENAPNLRLLTLSDCDTLSVQDMATLSRLLQRYRRQHAGTPTMVEIGACWNCVHGSLSHSLCNRNYIRMVCSPRDAFGRQNWEVLVSCNKFPVVLG